MDGVECSHVSFLTLRVFSSIRITERLRFRFAGIFPKYRANSSSLVVTKLIFSVSDTDLKIRLEYKELNLLLMSSGLPLYKK